MAAEQEVVAVRESDGRLFLIEQTRKVSVFYAFEKSFSDHE